MPVISGGPGSQATRRTPEAAVTPSKNTARMLESGKNLDGPYWFAFGAEKLVTHVTPFTLELGGEKLDLRVINRQLEVSTRLDTLAGRPQPSRPFRPATRDEARALANLVVKTYQGTYDGALNPETASLLLRAAHRRTGEPTGREIGKFDVQSGADVLRNSWVKDAELSWEYKTEITLTLTTPDGPVRLWMDRLTNEVRIDESFGARSDYQTDQVRFRTPTATEKSGMLTALRNRVPHVPYDVARFEFQKVTDIFARALESNGVVPLPPPERRTDGSDVTPPPRQVDGMESYFEEDAHRKRGPGFLTLALFGIASRR